jgi:hypothetical protein
MALFLGSDVFILLHARHHAELFSGTHSSHPILMRSLGKGALANPMLKMGKLRLGGL